MLEFNAASFYLAVSSIHYAQGRLAELKQDQSEQRFPMEAIMDGDALVGPLERMTDMDGALRTIGAKVTKIKADRIARVAREGTLTWGNLFEMMEELSTTLRDELTLHKIFVLEDHNLEYFEPSQPLFGSDVDTKFRTEAAFEIDEAAKCLALA